MREAEINRKTAETDIRLRLVLEGTGRADIDTGCGFLDHMLDLFACHGRFDLYIKCKGDTQVDYHHSVEDIGIALGQAFSQCLGDKRGICRYGSIILPMDEALVLVALDISGRSYLGWEAEIPAQKVGDFDCELAEEFAAAFSRSAGITLHIRKLAGRNSHHIIEAVFKALARAMAAACAVNPDMRDEIPSSKGIL